ncbi:MAG: hypothetical protein QMB16_05830 [Paracoccaceae bacterium]
MLADLKSALSQSTTAVFEDFLGVVALFSMLVALLCLPGSF